MKYRRKPREKVVVMDPGNPIPDNAFTDFYDTHCKDISGTKMPVKIKTKIRNSCEGVGVKIRTFFPNFSERQSCDVHTINKKNIM